MEATAITPVSAALPVLASTCSGMAMANTTLPISATVCATSSIVTGRRSRPVGVTGIAGTGTAGPTAVIGPAGRRAR